VEDVSSAESQQDAPVARPFTPPRRLMVYATAWYIGGASLIAVFYFARPSAHLALWLTLGLSSAAASFLGTHVNQPPRRLPWHLLALAILSLISGDTIYNILTEFIHETNPFPSVADASYLFTYPLAASGLVMMIRMRSPHRDATALVDSLLLAGGLALLIWVFTITPTVRERQPDWFHSAVSIAYPIGDVLLIAVILRLLTGGGVRGLSPALLVLGALGLMASDVAYALIQLYGTWHIGGPADLGWVVFYISWGAAPLHPSMVRLTEPHEPTVSLTAGRVIPLALAALIAPVVLLVEAARNQVKDAAVIAVFSAFMFLLVIVRLTLQSRQQRYQESIAATRAMVTELRNRAYHDSLTGLGNRARFQEQTERAFTRVHEQGGVVCMLLIDLDNFKEVNDTLGHRAGDELLITAARRLAATVRPGDLPARFGGDEFAVLLAEGSTTEGAEALAARLIETFRAPFVVGETQAEVRASIGFATSADSGHLVAEKDEADVLLRNADLALYAAKESGKGTWTRYHAGLHEAALERLSMRASLDHAIERGELFLVYQPIVDLRGPERVSGFEALVRWQHPDLGLLAPDQFIPLAEETGQVVQLGDWIIGQAVADAARWNSARPAADARYVTVNASAHQFLEPSFVASIERRLEERGLPSRQLVLEITETAFLHHHGLEVSRNLRALSRIGVRVAVDDFGTGYSNIAYLRDLHIDLLKADRSFVERIAGDPDHLRLLQGIVTVASALQIDVVAEGVETARQRDLLRGMGCAYGQGFYFSPAVPVDRVAEIAAELEGHG
jgi:diguanylate cyclase (GGDEF)-like protein